MGGGLQATSTTRSARGQGAGSADCRHHDHRRASGLAHPCIRRHRRLAERSGRWPPRCFRTPSARIVPRPPPSVPGGIRRTPPGVPPSPGCTAPRGFAMSERSQGDDERYLLPIPFGKGADSSGGGQVVALDERILSCAVAPAASGGSWWVRRRLSKFLVRARRRLRSSSVVITASKSECRFLRE